MDTNNSQNKQADAEVENLAKAALDQSADALPASINAKLAEARKAAITSAGKNDSSDQQGGSVVDLNSKRGLSSRTTMMWGMAASVTLASFLWFYQASNDVNIQDPALAGNSTENQQTTDNADGLLLAMELAQLDSDSAEIIDDLDFIYWLSLENETEV